MNKINSVIAAVIITIAVTQNATYATLDGNSTNNTKTVGDVFRETYKIMDNFSDFTDICGKYAELQVWEEITKCDLAYQEFNEFMDQLYINHNETIDKNLNLSKDLEDNN